MVVIHKSWCGACKALGPKIASSEEIASLAPELVLVNVHDDEEPTGDLAQDYTPDGGYIPRVLFVHPDGRVLPEFFSKEGNPKYKYFYSDPATLAKTMRMAIEWSKSNLNGATPNEEL
jgi:protein-disulfide reductase (glutathione)